MDRSIAGVVRDGLPAGRQVPADAPRDPCGGGLDRVPRQVRISGGRLDLGVAQPYLFG